MNEPCPSAQLDQTSVDFDQTSFDRRQVFADIRQRSGHVDFHRPRDFHAPLIELHPLYFLLFCAAASAQAIDPFIPVRRRSMDAVGISCAFRVAFLLSFRFFQRLAGWLALRTGNYYHFRVLGVVIFPCTLSAVVKGFCSIVDIQHRRHCYGRGDVPFC